MVEPEVVATSPYRIKSPVPVFCGISSRKLALAVGLGKLQKNHQRETGTSDIPDSLCLRFRSCGRWQMLESRSRTRALALKRPLRAQATPIP